MSHSIIRKSSSATNYVCSQQNPAVHIYTCVCALQLLTLYLYEYKQNVGLSVGTNTIYRNWGYIWKPWPAITSFSCPTLRPQSHIQCTNLFPNSSRIKSNCFITKFQLTAFVFFEFKAKLKWKQEAGKYSPHRAVFTAQMLSIYLGNTLPTF